MLGNIAGAQADPLVAGLMIHDLPPGSTWSLAGIGDTQLSMNMLALACGGGVRVGLEDNIWFDRNRCRLASNTELLGRIRRIAEELERPVMQPQDFRHLMHLEAGNGRYGRRAEMEYNESLQKAP